jgi:hypothetical protein
MRRATTILAAAAACALAAAARADDEGALERWLAATLDGRTTSSTELYLARLMVSEGGWDSERDHAAVAWSIAGRLEALGRRRGSTVRTLDDAIFRYADVLADPRTDRQRWVSALPVPPPGVPWERPRVSTVGEPLPSRAEAWGSILGRARAFLEGRLACPCAERPDHWGGPVDDERAARAVARGAMREVDCGSTGNRFFVVVPRRERRPSPAGVIVIGGRRIRIVG